MPPFSTIRGLLISPPHASVNAPPVSIAILGNDAVLASAPARPVQLMHAALAAGFDAVLPASLGDELVAGETLRLAQLYGRRPVVQCACPFAQAQLCSRDAHMETVAIPVAPAAVALARALRLERGHDIHITYIGGCPGAQDPAIDLQVLPARFLRGLQEKGIRIADQPDVFLDRLPPDRRRFLSEPGGLPRGELVDTLLRRDVVALSGRANPLLAVADALFNGGVTMIDPAGAYHCVCAGADAERSAAEGRAAVVALEPMRASAPIIEAPARLDLRPTPPPPPAMAGASPLSAPARPVTGHTAQPAPEAAVAAIAPPPEPPREPTSGRATPIALETLKVPPVTPLRAPSLDREVPLAAARETETAPAVDAPALPRMRHAAWLGDELRLD
jgi:hypothetical protein